MTSACFSRGHTGFSRNATLVATVNPPALAGGVFNCVNQQSFRNWAPGNGAAGATNQPGLPHAKGQWRGGLILAGTESGVVFASSTGQANIGGSPSSFLHAIIGIDLSRGSDIYGNSDTVMPASVNLPVCFYLGRPA